jgi:CRISPR-associated protein Csm1
MREKLFNITIGALLHDIGKVIYRAGRIDGRAHPISGMNFLNEFTAEQEILEHVSFHHAKDIRSSFLPNDSTAYITYCADNISAGVDRRRIEGDEQEWQGFDKSLPMATVFNILCNNNTNRNYRLLNNEAINFPDEGFSFSESKYNALYQDLKNDFKGIELREEYLDSILELLEGYLSYVPCSTLKNEVADISLYDHQKLTAAIASCIYIYLNDQYQYSNDSINYRNILFDNEKDFRKINAFLLFSCDISGIQQFIYNISSKGALKGLRSRSFYLEILLEHIVDEILFKTDLSRANLIYTGGGHAYILLPNTQKARKVLEDSSKTINKWLINNFGISLFIAADYVECSGNDLMNIPYDEEPCSKIFRDLSGKLSRIKQKRYTAEEIRLLNKGNKDSQGRECRICGSIDINLDKTPDANDICNICGSLEDISTKLLKDDTLLLTAKSEILDEKNIIIPSIDEGNDYLYVLGISKVKEVLKDDNLKEEIIKIYGKNKMHTGFKYATNLWVGTYHYKTNNTISTFEELASQSEGIRRLAVLRADVDSLGAAFVSGFEKKYETLSRTATLSRQLSLFFKFHINSIFSNQINGINAFSLSQNKKLDKRKLAIVYSGGDDVFIVGAWDEVIEAAVDLRRAFKKYSADALTFSAGISLFPEKYPISRIAEESAILEQAAKSIDENKNGISLFGEEFYQNEEGEYEVGTLHTYKWDVFIEKVIEEKLRLLQKFFNGSELDKFKGNSFLYKLLDYIKKADNEKINIARIAYLLGKEAPTGDDKDRKPLYSEFSSKVYSWILNPIDRKQLTTAIILYVYLNREKGE